MNKLIYVMAAGVGGVALRTTITAVRGRNEIVLRDPVSRDVPVLGGPNVNAVYGTDNADAFRRAYAQGSSDVRSAPSAALQDYSSRRVPSVGPGAFLVGSPVPALTVPGLGLLGAGPMSSIVFWCEAGPLIQLGRFDSNPRNVFRGRAPGFRLSGVSIVNPLERPLTYEGKRRATGLQDNGSGSVSIVDCQFAGLRYGFSGAYGSDFTRIGSNVAYQWCDVGAYFGPGSQQLLLSGTDFFACREGLVLEGALQLNVNGCSFEDPAFAAITVEARTRGLTRSGVPVSVPGHAYAGSWSVSGTWFESNAGSSGRLAPRMVFVRGDGPDGVAPAGLSIRDSILVSGGTQVRGGANCFVEYSSGHAAAQPVIIDNLRVEGSFINALFSMTGSAPTSRPVISATPLPRQVRAVRGAASGAVVMDSTRIAAASAPQGRTISHSRRGPIQLRGTTGGRWVVRLGADVTASSVSPPSKGSFPNPLTIEWRQDRKGGHHYVWPTTCRFRGGRPPVNRRGGSRTVVSFDWNPRTARWVETGRTVFAG